MKKFLTVLLVIAVMFTFSFGTAMAETGATYTYAQAYDLLDKTASDLIAKEKVKMDYAASTYTEQTISVGSESITISKDAAKEAFQELYEDYCDAINEEVAKQKDALDALYAAGTSAFTDGTTAYGTETFSTGDVAGAATAPSLAQPSAYDVTTIDQAKVLKAEFKVVKADSLAALAKIDTTVYSTNKPAGASETPAQIAERLVAQAIAQVTAYTVDTDSPANIAKKIGYIKGIYTAGEGTAPATGALAIGGTIDRVKYDAGVKAAPALSGLNDLTKTSTEVKDSAKLEYAKAKALASLTAEINAAQKTMVDALENEILTEKLKDNPNTKTIAQKEAAIEDAKADYAKILEVVTYYVNYQEKYSALATFNANSFTSVVLHYSDNLGLYSADNTTVATEFTKDSLYKNYSKANMIAMAKNVAAAKDAADLAKATIDIAGETYVEIDKLLEDAIENIYIKGLVSYSFNATAEDYLYHYVENKLIGGGAKGVRINTVDYDGIASWYADKNYDAAKQDEAKAAVKAAKAAVRKAATVEEAQTAFLSAWATFDAIPTKTEHSTDFLSGKYKAKYEEVKAELNAYASYKNGLYNQTGNYKKDAAKKLAETYTKATDGKFYTKCFNDEELAAMLTEAKAAIDALKTTEAIKTEAAAINTEINALPKLASVKLENKDAITAAFDKVLEHNDYCDAIGDATNKVRTGTIGMLVGKIADLEEEAINDAYNAIMKDGKVTVDEATAVEALRTAYDAYVEFWSEDGYKTYKDNALLGADGVNLDNMEDALLTAQVKEVVRLVNALPATGADSAAVAKVAAAFEALGRDGKDMLYHAYPREYSKLVDLQKLVAGNVETLKLTAKSTAKKGSITVKWTVKGDASAADGYQVWKSTKQSKGYKKAITTTKKSYKNTKGLKKGTRYYYKVRAYKVVDGKNVYSDWSNKAYRVAK